jgi:hypothetical protein
MEWDATGNRIMGKNCMLGLAFKSMAIYLTKLEDSPEDWLHSNLETFPILPG